LKPDHYSEPEVVEAGVRFDVKRTREMVGRSMEYIQEISLSVVPLVDQSGRHRYSSLE
jgi:hypothetical protein